MPALHLAFEDGFVDDEVVVALDGHELARAKGLNSSLATALAATRSVQTGAARGELSVSVTGNALQGTVSIDLTATPHVGIAVREGRLVLRPSADPPMYL